MLINPITPLRRPPLRVSEPPLNSPNWTWWEAKAWRNRVLGTSDIKFLTTSDYKTNSPGEWAYVQSQMASKDLFADVWQCFPSYVGVAIPNVSGGDPGLPENNLCFLYWAFYYFITKDLSVGNRCVAFMMLQIAETSCDFGDTTRFASGVWGDGAPVRDVAAWGLRLLQFYQYTYNLYTNSQRQLIDEFFFKMAIYWMDRNVVYDLLANNFDVFGDETYTIKSSLDTTTIKAYTHYGGNAVYNPLIFNNRRACANECYGAIGVHFTYFGHQIRPTSVALTTNAEVTTKISEMLSNSRNYNKGLIIFGTYADGLFIDSKRGAEDAGDTLTSPSRPFDATQYEDAYGYPIVALHCATRLEMQKMRAGLSHLLDWTTDKVYTAPTKTVASSGGVVKGLKQWADKLVGLYKDQYTLYARHSNTSPALGSDQVINGKCEANGKVYFRHLAYMAEANLYWKDSTMSALYQGDAGYSFPTAANAFGSGVGQSQTGAHGQSDCMFLKHVAITSQF